MAKQTASGKAFEFSLLQAAISLLSDQCRVHLVKDRPYLNAQRDFQSFSVREQDFYRVASKAAFRHIILLEPRLNHSEGNDILTIQIAPDQAGKRGDVRDVLFIRSVAGWEIGISAKNNHRAVKHSRISEHIDFGKEWFGLSCGTSYFEKVAPFFRDLSSIASSKTLWNNVPRKKERFYVPLLEIFRDTMVDLDMRYPKEIPKRLVSYLIGSKDFYKVIKENHRSIVMGFNINGTLNQNVGTAFPKDKVSLLRLPSEIVRFDFKRNSKTTLILICDEGWQISFRMHSASSYVERSLKFDVQLIGFPQSLYQHRLHW